MRFEWQHISYLSGANPYICKTEKEFNRIKRKYGKRLLKSATENFWYVDDIKEGGDDFC